MTKKPQPAAPVPDAPKASDTVLASFIWKNAEDLWGDFKHTDFGKIILPFTLLRRLDAYTDRLDHLCQYLLNKIPSSTSRRIACLQGADRTNALDRLTV